MVRVSHRVAIRGLPTTRVTSSLSLEEDRLEEAHYEMFGIVQYSSREFVTIIKIYSSSSSL